MSEPIPMLLWCPSCRARHVDEGDFATRVHHTHACQSCGLSWRPAIVPTVGVLFLPGFKDVPLERDDKPKVPKHLLELMYWSRNAEALQLSRRADELLRRPLPGQPGATYYSGFYGDIEFTPEHPDYRTAVKMAKELLSCDVRAEETISISWRPDKSPDRWSIASSGVGERWIMTDDVLSYFPAPSGVGR